MLPGLSGERGSSWNMYKCTVSICQCSWLVADIWCLFKSCCWGHVITCKSALLKSKFPARLAAEKSIELWTLKAQNPHTQATRQIFKCYVCCVGRGGGRLLTAGLHDGELVYLTCPKMRPVELYCSNIKACSSTQHGPFSFFFFFLLFCSSLSHPLVDCGPAFGCGRDYEKVVSAGSPRIIPVGKECGAEP